LNWRELKAAPPGERFERAYRANRAQGKRGWKRAAAILAGALLVALGLFMLVAPGPGILVLVLGAALVGGESQPMARFLDRAELRIRRAISALRKNV
jgi:ferric-dicitrate binding protein FerR (iron transport regulator)